MVKNNKYLNCILYVAVGMILCPPSINSVIHELLHKAVTPCYDTILLTFLITCLLLYNAYLMRKELLFMRTKQFPLACVAEPTASMKQCNNSNKMEAFYKTLTPQEKVLVSLILQGYTGSSIAKLMTISMETQKSYRKSIYSKLDIHSKEELFMLAHSLSNE